MSDHVRQETFEQCIYIVEEYAQTMWEEGDFGEAGAAYRIAERLRARQERAES